MRCVKAALPSPSLGVRRQFVASTTKRKALNQWREERRGEKQGRAGERDRRRVRGEAGSGVECRCEAPTLFGN